MKKNISTRENKCLCATIPQKLQPFLKKYLSNPVIEQLHTVETAIQNGFKGIVAQAKKMIFLNQKECIELANKNNIFIIAKKI